MLRNSRLSCAEASQRIRSSQAADFANLLWALAASNQLQSDTVAPLLASMGELPAGSFDAAALRQLAMVRASLPDPGVFAQHVPQPLQQRIDQANQALPGADASKVNSGDVMHTPLQLLGLTSHQCNHA